VTPVLFHIGPYAVYTYGVLAAAGMLTVFMMLPSRAARAGVPLPVAMDMLFFLFVAGILGARALFVLQHFDDYAGRPLDILSLREGGLVWYGGFIAAATFGSAYAVVRRWPLLKLCDLFSPLAALAHGVGRLGCFLNGCCWGRVTDSSWGVLFPGEEFARHPVQLYEAGALFALALWLDRLSTRPGRREGSTFTAYLGAYAAVRFGLEFLRGDQMPYAGLTLPQWTSLAFAAGAVFLYLSIRRRGSGH